MGAIVVVLLLALLLAAAVMVYAAYPYRGEDTPLTPLLGAAMRRGVQSLPTIDPEPAPDHPSDRQVSIAPGAQVDSHR